MQRKGALLMVVAVLFALVLPACGVINDVATVGQLGNDFMTALKEGDGEGSWTMLTQDVQDEIGDPTAWQEFVDRESFSDWKFTNTQVENNVGQIDGEATFEGDTYTLLLIFDKVDGNWLISGINFSLK